MMLANIEVISSPEDLTVLIGHERMVFCIFLCFSLFIRDNRCTKMKSTKKGETQSSQVIIQV